MTGTHEALSAWESFCDDLKSAGRLLLRPTTPQGEIDQVTGARALSRNIALALQFELENNDPLYPELLHYFDPIRKQGGDNTDAIYVGAPVNGHDTYLIHGDRGTARYFAITVLEDGATPWGGKVVGSLLGKDLSVDDDGSFRVTLSPEPQPGNWIRTSPGSYRVTIRQFFGNWSAERPMRARIDRLGADPLQPPPVPDAQHLSRGLAAAARWVDVSLNYWADMLDRWQLQPHVFLSYRELDHNAIDATPGGEPLICYWKVKRGEVLLVRVRPPAGYWWGVEFGNYYWETMDYRYRLCSTNCDHAVIEDDGELIVVVSHEDPGLPNWLDPSGYEEGYITFRWIGTDHYPRPDCHLKAASELPAALPPAVKRISREARSAQLLDRRTGILQRFEN